MSDPFKVLGLNYDCTEDQVKTAFRRMAMDCHPDRNKGNKDAEDKFKTINAAYETLKDPEKRRQAEFQFDPSKRGQQPHPHFAFHFGGHPGPQGHGNPFDDIFRQFGFHHPMANNDVNVQLSVSLEDAYNGKQTDLTIHTHSGPRQVKLDIPAGVTEGTRLRVAGLGERIVPQLPPGDLYVVIQITPHHRFRVINNMSLLTEVDINAIDAMIGTDVEVTTIDGSKVMVAIPSGAQNGQKFRVAGLGMPHLHNQKQRGDLLVGVRIIVPTRLSAEHIATLKDLRQSMAEQK
jgi:curved DNA-binding protein